MRYSCAHWMSPPMLSPDEAREEAWREWMKFREGEDQDAPGWRRLHIAWNIGWDARGRYDDQRIAELVAAAERFKAANDALTELHEREAINSTKTDAEWAGLVSDAWFEHDRARDALYAALRALGQSEEVKP